MSLRHARLNARRWARVRRAVFERDGYRCTACHRPGRLEAHHEPPLRAGGDPYDVTEIKTLCRSCHVDRHRRDDMAPDRTAWLDYLGEFSCPATTVFP